VFGSLARTLARAPVWLYRARLGFLFGNRFLLIEHIGRRTGSARYVVVEVVERPGADRYVVASGFGERAQWFRNVLVTPRVRVSVGRRRLVPADASVLDPADAAAAVRRYRTAHPWAWRVLRPLLERIAPAVAGSPDELASRIPMVELALRQ
jgi:deazaflavin-dependent oxidoreductase (nitroreductase family)